MKLLWHEFKTEALRRRWLLILWWLIVLIDFGYQVDWWQRTFTFNVYPDGPPDLTPRHFHNFAAELIRSAIWIGLVLAALVWFSAFSTSRSSASLRVRPVSLRSRIIGRTLWLILLIGLPWWLHEYFYVSRMADVDAAFTARAVFERFLISMAIWTGAAVLGWVAGGLWRSIGLAIIIVCFGMGSLFLDEWLTHLRTSRVFHMLVNGSSVWSNFSMVLILAGGLLIGHFWQQNGRVSSRWKIWLPLIFASLVVIPLSQAVEDAVQSFIVSKVARNETLPANWRPGIDTELSSASISPDTPVPIWTLAPDFSELPESIGPVIAAARGELRNDDGIGLGELSSRAMAPQATLRELQNAHRSFPGSVIFSHAMLYPYSALSPPSTMLTPDRERASLPTPEMLAGTRFHGSAQIDIDLWRMGEWSSLPLDGSRADMGSLRQVHFVGSASQSLDSPRPIPRSRDAATTVFIIRFHQAQTFTDASSAIEPRRVFGLWHSEKNQLILIPHGNSSRIVRGAASAFPLRQMELEVPGADWGYSQEWQDAKTRRSLRQDMHLVLMESTFIGGVSETLKQGDLTFSEPGHVGTPLFLLRDRQQQTSAPPPWQDPQSTEAEARKAVYHLSSDWSIRTNARSKPAPESATTIADVHRPLLRQLAIESPVVLHRFDKAWNNDDIDWFLDRLTDPNTRSSLSRLTQLAAQLGWLEQRPDWLRQQIRQDPESLPTSAIEVAARLDIADARVELYRRQISGHAIPGETIDPNEHENERATFARIRKQVEGQLRLRWQKHRWQKDIAGWIPSDGILLARLGDPQPLRELLSAYLQQVAELPKTMTDHPAYFHWEQLSGCFAETDDVTAATSEDRMALAKRWLAAAAEWKFDPATRLYQVPASEAPAAEK